MIVCTLPKQMKIKWNDFPVDIYIIRLLIHLTSYLHIEIRKLQPIDPKNTSLLCVITRASISLEEKRWSHTEARRFASNVFCWKKMANSPQHDFNDIHIHWEWKEATRIWNIEIRICCMLCFAFEYTIRSIPQIYVRQRWERNCFFIQIE